MQQGLQRTSHTVDLELICCGGARSSAPKPWAAIHAQNVSGSVPHVQLMTIAAQAECPLINYR